MSFFNTNEVTIQPDYEILPIGKYMTMVEVCEPKRTKDGLGVFIALTLNIVDGQHAGRKIFINFNIENQNKQAAEIGCSDFAKFLLALDVKVLNRPEECAYLQGKMLFATVKHRKNKASGELEIVCRIFESVNQGQGQFQQQQQQQQMMPQQQQQQFGQPPPNQDHYPSNTQNNPTQGQFQQGQPTQSGGYKPTGNMDNLPF